MGVTSSRAGYLLLLSRRDYMYSTVVKVYSVLTGLALAAANSWHHYVQSLQMNFSCLMPRFFERETRSRCRESHS